MNSLKCLFLSLIIGMAVFPFDSLADSRFCSYIGQFLTKRPQSPDPGETREFTMPVENAIRLATATNWHTRNNILTDYAQSNRENLSAGEAISLAKATVTWRVKDGILVNHARHHKKSLSVDDVISLAKAIVEWSTRDDILLNYARHHRGSISFDDALRLAKAAYDWQAHDTILRVFYVSRP